MPRVVVWRVIVRALMGVGMVPAASVPSEPAAMATEAASRPVPATEGIECGLDRGDRVGS